MLERNPHERPLSIAGVVVCPVGSVTSQHSPLLSCPTHPEFHPGSGLRTLRALLALKSGFLACRCPA